MTEKETGRKNTPVAEVYKILGMTHKQITFSLHQKIYHVLQDVQIILSFLILEIAAPLTQYSYHPFLFSCQGVNTKNFFASTSSNT